MAVWILPLAVLAIALALRITEAAGVAERVQDELFDAYQRAIPRVYADPRAQSGYGVRYVDFDGESLTRHGAWPWPRMLIARLVDRLREGGAAVVVLTGPLSYPDPLSPERVIEDAMAGTPDTALGAALSKLPSSDARLAAALDQVKSVTGFMLGDRVFGRAPTLKTGVAFVGPDDSGNGVPSFPAAEGALEAIEQASTGVGALNISGDFDGGLRRLPLLMRLGSMVVPTIDAEALRLIGERPNIVARAPDAKEGILATPSGIAAIQAGLTIVPVSPDGRMWIHFGPRTQKRRLSAWRVLDGIVEADELEDAIVYIGGAEEALYATPMGAARTATEIRAEAMEQILLGQFLRRPVYAKEGELLFLGLAGLAIVILLARAGLVWAGLCFVTAAAAGGYFSWRMFGAERLLFDAAYPVLGLGFVLATGAITRVVTVTAERRRLIRTFAQLLPARTMALVARAPGLLKLAGEARTMSYLVCGVRGFTTLSQSYAEDPRGFARMMRRAMTPLADAVLEHRGAVDRLTPGGLTAFFNAPVDDPDHAVHACECALRMTEALEDVNRVLEQERRADGMPAGTIEIGIGVNTGPGVVGDFGTSVRAEYTAGGEAAMRAADIQTLSAKYGPAILVGEAARAAAEKSFAFLEVDLVSLPGRAEPLRLYALLGNPLVRASPKFRALQTFHEHIFQAYRDRQWSRARALIDQCRALSGASPRMYDLYLARIAYFERHPAGADWNGAYRPILE